MKNTFKSFFGLAGGLLLLSASSFSHAVMIETEATGGGAAHENRMPSLAVGYYVQTAGSFDAGLGRVRMFAGSPPSGWAKADGQVLPIIGNEGLFSKVGTSYGGNGETTFALPDLRNGAVVHEGQGPGLSNWNLGQTKGSNTVTLTEAQIPSHDHQLDGSTERTGQTGGDQAHSNLQQSTALKYGIAVRGIYPTEGGGSITSDEPMVGEIRAFSGATPLPRGFVELDGQVVLIAQNSSLFSIIGTTYGGDGETTFRLPDMRGRVAVHAGNGPGLPPVSLGEKGGVETVSLTEANLPSHEHDYLGGLTTEPTGAGLPHENRQPFIAFNYAISPTGVFPNFNGPLSDSGEAFLAEIIMFAGNFAPQGSLLLDGQLLAITQYQALFSLLGTIYGGDGETTFALPDLRGRTPIQAFGEYGLGQMFGQASVSLTNETMPSHTHQLEGSDPASVPAPMTLALLGLGLAAMGVARKRQVK